MVTKEELIERIEKLKEEFSLNSEEFEKRLREIIEEVLRLE